LRALEKTGGDYQTPLDSSSKSHIVYNFCTYIDTSAYATLKSETFAIKVGQNLSAEYLTSYDVRTHSFEILTQENSDGDQEVSGVRVTHAEKGQIDKTAIGSLELHMVSFEIQCDKLNDSVTEPEFVEMRMEDPRHPLITLKHRAGCPVELSDDLLTSRTRKPTNWWITGAVLIIVGFITATRGRD
jgi:hypothetical protein